VGDHEGDTSVWISQVPEADVSAGRAAGDGLPLAGVAFGVKDNIDVAGIPTTLGAPSLGYTPTRSAAVVERLVGAGAVVAGKTNLDQFATGLVGTRSPHFGICRNPIDAAFIAGGSSAGSAVAVATGDVDMALGTDTAGSGRVPAACCGIVGFKPTPGAVSTEGVFPASPSFDCVSVFTRTCREAERVMALVGDVPQTAAPRAARVGVPTPLRWFGDDEARELFEVAVSRLGTVGLGRVEIDAMPLYDTGDLLYGSALVAERRAAFGHLVERDPGAVDPAVRAVVDAGAEYDATDVFNALATLASLRRAASATWRRADVVVVPTVARHPAIDEVLADPVGPNRELGTYTAFVNLLGWAAIAVPAGTRGNGLPFGVSIIGPAGSDRLLLDLGARFLGETEPGSRSPDGYEIAVVGAHLTGQPLNHELVERGGELVATDRTAPRYRLYALSTTPAKPGLVRADAGAAIELEVWRLPAAGFADFVAAVPRPLAIGTVELAGGREVSGFVCEPAALVGAEDITNYGSWRAWLSSFLSAASSAPRAAPSIGLDPEPSP
jgi:allophanate hydrolase